ncbi:MAG: FeS assembly ATPase SufC [candidate division TM6 bacterium GW2011_GWF2_32_72]|nr:MAG: FeS assembly ATPase SufC [candidate division TM6 bacterium GW2011_GWF2_32_72]
MNLLNLKKFLIKCGEKIILQKSDLEILPGQRIALIGANGSGKTSLALALAGHPKYVIVADEFKLFGQNAQELKPSDRACLGLFVSFQNPCEIPGLSLYDFLREAHKAKTGHCIPITDFRELVNSSMELLGLDSKFLYRDLNVGFSGGEKKKLELLQLLVLQPRFAILDEIDSGLDIQSKDLIKKVIEKRSADYPDFTVLLISHDMGLCESLNLDFVYRINNGVVEGHFSWHEQKRITHEI